MLKIGYVLCGHDNDSYLLHNETSLNRCPTCNDLLDRNCSAPSFRLTQKRDVSVTYDGYTIVSQRFVNAWARLHGTGLHFAPLPSEPGYYICNAVDVLEFDAERRETRFVNWRPCCNRYHSVAGATPAYLKHPEQLTGRHAFRTDLLFGSGDEKDALILLPRGIGDDLKAERLTGLDMADVVN